jgi:hypothetical protein
MPIQSKGIEPWRVQSGIDHSLIVCAILSGASVATDKAYALPVKI